MEPILKKFKSCVELDDLAGAQSFLQAILSAEDASEEIAWDYLYQKIYLHACLKKRRKFVEWMDTLFEGLDPIEKVALRQMFAYGRYLLNK
jgi:hypothetical protein